MVVPVAHVFVAGVAGSAALAGLGALAGAADQGARAQRVASERLRLRSREGRRRELRWASGVGWGGGRSPGWVSECVHACVRAYVAPSWQYPALAPSRSTHQAVPEPWYPNWQYPPTHLVVQVLWQQRVCGRSRLANRRREKRLELRARAAGRQQRLKVQRLAALPARIIWGCRVYVLGFQSSGSLRFSNQDLERARAGQADRVVMASGCVRAARTRGGRAAHARTPCLFCGAPAPAGTGAYGQAPWPSRWHAPCPSLAGGALGGIAALLRCRCAGAVPPVAASGPAAAAGDGGGAGARAAGRNQPVDVVARQPAAQALALA